MLNRIKVYLYGVVATAFALLLALVGVQRKTINRQQYEALRKERDEQRARADAAIKQAKAKAKAAEEAQARRAQVERDMEQGDRGFLNRINKAAFAAIFLAGCAANEQYAPLPSACPPMPTLPLIYARELQTLSDDVYRRLVERELRLKEHIGQLRALCGEE